MDSATYTSSPVEGSGHYNVGESYTDKLVKRKKKLTINLVEFLIGFVLLVFCFNYLSTHPAEKLSVFSSVDVLLQKAKVAISQRTHGQGNELKVKYSLERSYKEMLGIVEDANCLDVLQREEIRRMYTSLQRISVDEFVQQEPLFVEFISKTYDKVQKECNIKQE